MSAKNLASFDCLITIDGNIATKNPNFNADIHAVLDLALNALRAERHDSVHKDCHPTIRIVVNDSKLITDHSLKEKINQLTSKCEGSNISISQVDF